MLPLIAGYDHNPAVVSLPPRVPLEIGERFATVLAEFPFLVPKLDMQINRIYNSAR